MRIYSNTLLSWTESLHIFQAARLYHGIFRNYNIYKINVIKPLILTTDSPIELLEENCQYYCYDRYYRNKYLEQFGNTFELASIINKKAEFEKETCVYIPKMAEVNNIIVIRNDIIYGYPNIIDSNRINSYINSSYAVLQ